MTFTTLLQQLNQTWTQDTKRMRVIATRYYLGVINLNDLRQLAEPQQYGHSTGEPLLTKDQVKIIIERR